MLEARPVINNTKAPSRGNGACARTTFSTKVGRGCQSMTKSLMASAGHGGTARRGACDAVVILSPARLARTSAPPWLRIEAFEKVNTPLILLQHPCGDSPPGNLLTQRPGMIAEYERAQLAERTRRGRLENARHGECIPWASRCDGDRYRPTRHGYTPPVMIEPVEAAVVRDI